MTSEDQLKAIIEAQMKGGCIYFENLMENIAPLDSVTAPYIWFWGDGKQEPYHPLVILLDPEGLKAAYGEAPQDMTSEEYKFTGLREWHRDCGHQILNTWLTSNGDAAKTIETAYNLLPK